MKKIILSFLFVVCLLTNVKSQQYFLFPSVYGEWQYQQFDDSHEPTGVFSSNVLFGDTAINSFNYKKIFTDSIYSGALRENNKIIYFVPDTSSNEYVLYNFNLNVGDTIFNPFAGGNGVNPDTVTVIQIDSILTNNGYHRMLILSGLISWIEGIGSSRHLLQPTYSNIQSGDYNLDCFFNDSVLNLGSNCILGINESQSIEERVSIFPNPTTNQLTLQASFQNNEHTNIFIKNILGQVLFQFTITSEQTEIDVSNLSAGIYFIELQTDNGSFVKKFVKE